MDLKKLTLPLALASILSTNISQAAIIDMSFDGLFTWLDETGNALTNDSTPYYDDPTWRYGKRTQISGTIQYDTNTGFGSATITPFKFATNGTAIISNFEIKNTGFDNLLLGNMNFDWNGSFTTSQIVLDASGLFAELPTAAVGDIYDASTCSISGACATPASEDVDRGRTPIGPTPLSTSSFNAAGTTGFETTLAQLSLGIDDGIGGSPNDHGPFTKFNYNLDFTTLTVTKVSSVPVPAAIWLFGSGLIGLMGITRRRQR